GIDATSLDLENDLGLEQETRVTGRLKIDLPVVPTVYVVAAPMEFEGVGESVSFNFGDTTFEGAFSSKLILNQYDIGLYYGIPFLKTATLGKFNIDLGLNVRIVDINAEVSGRATDPANPSDLISITESEGITAPVPMLYLAAQFKPVDRFAVEVEARGMSNGDEKIYSLVGRVKVKVFGPAFAAGGYRYDVIELDEEGLIVDATFGGPFLEAGVQF
ncbi:MAG: TIGR04219 family outer membrane beta-barrel protein, partial [Deltaproteobacteria bacterium]|nr:TIGR04219 family outer membrane beta-barrel protein [Deltaproteobacteria bacterium]